MNKLFGFVITGVVIGGCVYITRKVTELTNDMAEFIEIQKDLLEIEIQEDVDERFEEITERFDEP